MGQPVALVAGTRPEVIKLRPVAKALAALGVRVHFLTVGQSAHLMEDALLRSYLGGSDGARRLELPEAVQHRPADDVGPLLAAMLERLAETLADLAPAGVVVQGDTMAAWAGALATKALRIPLAHVEAGLRSGVSHRPYPEEWIRLAISGLAAVHFAPTPGALENLAREGVTQGVYLVGNTSVDALFEDLADLAGPLPGLAARTVLVTCHRREGWRTHLPGLVWALRGALEDDPELRVLWPVHPNPVVVEAAEALRGHPRVELAPPMPRRLFVAALWDAWAVVTDSGGLIEEAATLGVPTLIVRDETERGEAVAAGLAQLRPCRIGTEADALRRAIRKLPRAKQRPPADRLFGDGTAGRQIAEHLVRLWPLS